MSRKFKSNIRPLSERNGGAKEYKPPAEPPNLAAKFMRENKAGSLPDEDTPAMTLAGEPVSAAPAAPVAAVEQTPATPAEPVAPAAVAAEPADGAPRGATETLDAAAQAALDAAAPPAPVADATGGSADVPVAPPVEGAVPAQPAAAAAPAIDKYDPREKISLLEGEPEWTRDDVVRGLQERATLQQEIEQARPAVAERDQLLKGLGAPDTKAAMAFVEPFVRAIRENPDRAKLLDTVAAMDPATLAYVAASLKEFNDAPIDQRQAWGQVGPQAQSSTPTDPRYEKLAANQQILEESLLRTRAEREVTTILSDWPFLRQDRKAWEAVQAVATALYSEDEAKGIPPLQRRGYMEAIAQQRHFLEIMKQAQERRVISHASDAARPAAAVPSTLGPPPTSAILPATHPQPPAGARPLVKREYRGSVDGAAAAFLADLGYQK